MQLMIWKPQASNLTIYLLFSDNSTAGSLALQGANFAEEAAVVGKLRAAGAIILGKTNVSEWGNARRTDGWSAVRGRTLGAYSDTQHPGGSSCGSAVAVRLGFAAAAVGTEVNHCTHSVFMIADFAHS